MHRTTVVLDDQLYREVKRKAVDRGQAMRRLVDEALRVYLGLNQPVGAQRRPTFGVYQARVIGSLRRKAIYGERLKRKAG